MNKKQFNNLLNNSNFLSLFYQAREKSERYNRKNPKYNLPLENCFMEIGLNRYKAGFPRMCLSWGIDNLIQIQQFNKKVMLI